MSDWTFQGSFLDSGFYDTSWNWKSFLGVEPSPSLWVGPLCLRWRGNHTCELLHRFRRWGCHHQWPFSGSHRGVFCIIGFSLIRYPLSVSHFSVGWFDKYDEIALKMLCVLYIQYIFFSPSKSATKKKSQNMLMKNSSSYLLNHNHCEHFGVYSFISVLLWKINIFLVLQK